ncbi:MAG: BatD family protein, partial [Candidatus Eisenbacteria bacterium]|nr:BatD family protein [Candidatus Eisenbacteria bacterium]
VRGNHPGDPEFNVPPGLELLGSGRMQSFSWVNGRSNAETIYRYELGAKEAGSFSLGPFHVRVGGQIVTAPPLELRVTASATRLDGGSSGEGAATLLAGVEPHEPYVGQPVVLRVRLVQRQQLAEDPQYVPPATPGFWSENASRPESYYAAEGNRRVLVTETRTRLYPLANGDQIVGEAIAHLALYDSGADDPTRWLGGRIPRREVVVRSLPVTVRVRPLPPGAPVGFDGAVGVISARWTCDRSRTPRDVAATVRLELRGIGNLPLIHVPHFESADFDVFAGTPDDSLGAPGQSAPGRRTFSWTVLSHREGRIDVPPPSFAWFDPSSETYRAADLASAVLEVQPPLHPGGGSRADFPRVFLEDALDPGARRALPWAFALAGLLLGVALALWRHAARPDPDQAERAGMRERLRAVGHAQGLDFWSAADQAAAWAEVRGARVEALREVISAARYGGGAPDPEKVRRPLIEQLGALMPRTTPRLPLRIASVSLAATAVALVTLFSPGAGENAGERERAREADRAAEAGDAAKAHAGWLALWKAGDREAALAARLSWSEIQTGSVGPAAAWALAGDVDDARDPALEWVRDRVRESGGLVGAGAGRIPVRRVEWALVALALGAVAGLGWPRAGVWGTAVALSVAVAAAFPAESAWLRRLDRAVVREPVTLARSLELESGQVVRIIGRGAGRVRVSAGHGVEGWVPAATVYAIQELE